MLRRYAFLAIILLAILTPATVAQNVTPDQVFALGFDAKQKGAFDKGEIISTGFKELSDKELALFMAVIVPAPMEKVMEFSRSGGSFADHHRPVSHGGQDHAVLPEPNVHRPGGRVHERHAAHRGPEIHGEGGPQAVPGRPGGRGQALARRMIACSFFVRP